MVGMFFAMETEFTDHNTCLLCVQIVNEDSAMVAIKVKLLKFNRDDEY